MLEKSSRTSRRIKIAKMSFESIEMDQSCGKFVESVGTDRHLEKWFRSSRWMTQAKTVSETL